MDNETKIKKLLEAIGCLYPWDASTIDADVSGYELDRARALDLVEEVDPAVVLELTGGQQSEETDTDDDFVRGRIFC